MRVLAIALVLLLLAGCSTTSVPSTQGTSSSPPSLASETAVKSYEEKPYDLSSFDFPFLDASRVQIPVEEYIAGSAGVIQASVGRIREDNMLFALDVKVEHTFVGVEQEYMQLLVNQRLAGAPSFPYEEGKVYTFVYHVYDALNTPEAVYMTDPIAFFPTEGQATYFGEPISIDESLFAQGGKAVRTLDKAAKKARGEFMTASDIPADIADYADAVAVVELTSAEETAKGISVAQGKVLHILKGEIEEECMIIVPTGTTLGENLVCMTRVEGPAPMYMVAARTGAVIPMADKELLRSTLEAIATVEGVSAETTLAALEISIPDGEPTDSDEEREDEQTDPGEEEKKDSDEKEEADAPESTGEGATDEVDQAGK